MEKTHSYSRYQRKAIKFLTEYLSSDTPFSYEKCASNHLKVLIEGVDHPIYTGCTPSDNKAIKNFMGDVKRAVKRPKMTAVNKHNRSQSFIPKQQTALCHDKLVKSCVRTLRGQLDHLKRKEECSVIENRNLSMVAPNRKVLIKKTLSNAIQSRQHSVYLTQKQQKHLEDLIGKHYDFIMPSLSYYADITNNMSSAVNTRSNVISIPTMTKTSVNTKLNTQQSSSSSGNTQAQADTKPLSDKKPLHTKVSSMTNTTTIRKKSEASDHLMALSQAQRIQQLQALTRAQLLMLIDDANDALIANRNRDIAEVVTLIRDKDLPVEQILEQLNA